MTKNAPKYFAEAGCTSSLPVSARLWEARGSAGVTSTDTPVSILVAFLYGLVIASVLFSDLLPKVDQTVTDLTKVRGEVVERRSTIRTYARLQITARPHPYPPHANSCVRACLLSRIKSIDSDIEVVDDFNSTVVCSSHPGVGVYFEGTNTLVKVSGSNKHSSNAVLCSAHYDSVSSVP